MLYLERGLIKVRPLAEADAETFAAEECAQGWNASEDKYRVRLADAASGRALALAADFNGCPAGYINLYYRAENGPFAGEGLLEIVDFGVLVKYRGRGVGAALMDAAEAAAAARSDAVTLGVGLHSGYGAAQRMYVKRGYVPDGSGVWYRDRPLGQYEECCNDDDLILFMMKKL